MAGFSLAGDIGDLFDPPHLKRIPWDTRIDSAIPGYVDYLTAARGSDVSDLAAYSAALKALQPEASRLAGQDTATFSDLINRNLNYDPMAFYERARTGNLAALDEWGAKLAGYGSAADKQALAMRGYGGRGPGTYENILRTDRISKNIAPIVGNVLSNLGRDSSIAQADRLNNLISTFQLMSARADRPYLTVNRLLDPMKARAASTAANLANFSNLTDTAKSNVAGLKEERGFWGKFGAVADNALNSYIDLYTGGMGGGGGGGGGGGSGMDFNKMLQMFGGGGDRGAGRNASNSQYDQFVRDVLQIYGGKNLVGGGGGGSVPGVNTGYPGFN